MGTLIPKKTLLFTTNSILSHTLGSVIIKLNHLFSEVEIQIFPHVRVLIAK